MIDAFEDHCWKDVIPDDVLKLYSHYKRDLYLGPKPALLAIDLYELAYQGGPHPVSEVAKDFPSSCGIHAWTAIPATVRLFNAARHLGLPIFYTTGDDRKYAKPTRFTVTNRRSSMDGVDVFKIRPEWAPQDGDVVITKQRASGFYGTALSAHLVALGVDTVIVCGESTSGCVRASTVDGYSNGFHMVVAEECCFDRSLLSHKVNLFDIHHKYADVMHVDEIIAELQKRSRD
jgi:nicotinamidase-related amidase